MAQVKLKDLAKKYPNGDQLAVKGINLDIEDKEFLVLVGPSGCGKTTTLRMVAGLEEITSGEIWIGDRLVNEVEPKDRDIAMVFQNYALYPHMNVYENLAFGLRLRRFPRAEIDRRVKEAAEILSIGGLLKRKTKELSGGQKQRVALGRAIVRNPAVFLMDEPLSNLDAKLRVQMRTEISKLHQRVATTFIYVTHDQEEALVLSDRIAVFNRGRIEQVGTGRELYDEPSTLFVGRFIGDSTVLRGGARSDGTGTALKIADETVTTPRRLSGDVTPVMLLRPEKLSIRRPGQPAAGQNRLSGRIAEAIYLGSGSKYEVALGDGSLAIVRSSLTDESFKIGEQVDLWFDGADAKLLADDASAETTLT